jgi:heterodisulfide reductase subunit C
MEKKKIKKNEFIKEIFKDPRIPEELGINRCIQCGNCSASCPAARHSSYRPRKIMQEILFGARNNLLENEDIWLCYSCFSCNLRCPRNNNPGVIIHVLRQLALKEGYGWEKVVKFKFYLESLRDSGIGWSTKAQTIEYFKELENDWVEIIKNMPEVLKELSMNPNSPRELPKEAKDQIKKILELANINEDISEFEEKEEQIKNQKKEEK